MGEAKHVYEDNRILVSVVEFWYTSTVCRRPLVYGPLGDLNRQLEDGWKEQCDLIHYALVNIITVKPVHQGNHK